VAQDLGYGTMFVTPQINIPLPPWLLTVHHNCKEAYGMVRRLGLPHTSLDDKCKYRKADHRDMPVQLTPSIARAAHGHDTGTIYMYSKKNQYGHSHGNGHGDHHNTHAPGVVHEKRYFMPWSPGVNAVIAANIMVWVALVSG